MLPLRLSAGACSLGPEVDRLAVTTEILIGADGRPRSASFYRSRVRSDERLSYGQLDEYFAGRAAPLGAGRRAARARPPCCGDAARQPPRLRARDLDHRAGIRVRLRRRRCRGPRGRADRGSWPDRAADDLRQRASGRALRAHRGADRLPRSRAPGPDAGRGAGGQARRARHPDTAAAQGDLVDLARSGGPAGRRGEPSGGGRGRAPPPRASGVYITCLALPEARHVLRRQPRPRRLGQPRLRPFHFPDPSLRGPGRPPGAAFHDRRRRGRAPSARRRATRRSPVRGSSARRW